VDGAVAFAARLGLPIRNLDLLDQALTHASWLHEQPDPSQGHNERLELLGDAVVNLVVTAALHERHPVDDEGLLSARRAAIVSTTGLARLAERLGVGEHLRLGEGEARGGGRRRPSVLASGFEAVAGAVFLDLGWQATYDWIVELARPEIERDEAPTALKSPKSRLQELTQQAGRERPVYRVVDVAGPDHQRRFVVEVVFEGGVRGVGEGSSRRTAETEAARQAIEALEGLRADQLRPERRAAGSVSSGGAEERVE
jgi:ribonuclease-3